MVDRLNVQQRTLHRFNPEVVYPMRMKGKENSGGNKHKRRGNAGEYRWKENQHLMGQARITSSNTPHSCGA